MGEQRVDAGKALESLAWHLNFFPGETLSYNKLAEATGLAWATARKYVQVLEELQKCSPELELTEDGVKVRQSSSAALHFAHDPVASAAFYLFIHGQLSGNPSAELDLEKHLTFKQKYTDGLQTLAAAGMAKNEGARWKLLPPGIAFGGSLYSEILQATARSSGLKEIVSDDLRTHLMSVGEARSYIRPTEFRAPRAPERRLQYAAAVA